MLVSGSAWKTRSSSAPSTSVGHTCRRRRASKPMVKPEGPVNPDATMEQAARIHRFTRGTGSRGGADTVTRAGDDRCSDERRRQRTPATMQKRSDEESGAHVCSRKYGRCARLRLDQLGTAESRAYKMWLPPLMNPVPLNELIARDRRQLRFAWGSWMNRAAIYRMCGAWAFRGRRQIGIGGAPQTGSRRYCRRW